LKEPHYDLDSTLLKEDFNPFHRICEKGRDQRDQLHEYRAFKDYLTYLKIIGNRIKNDSKKYNELTSLADPNRWPITYELQTDIESFIIFSHILLGKVGILMDKLLCCRTPHEWSPYFSKHREAYIKVFEMCPQYSEILKKMYWYAQNFDYLRNKIIVHSRSLVGSMRYYTEYRKINKHFGQLSADEQKVVQNFIIKYGKGNEEILSISSNPNFMLDDFLALIMKYNLELDKQDLNKLGEMVQRNGGTIEVTILSRHLRKFLEEIGSFSNSHEFLLHTLN